MMKRYVNHRAHGANTGADWANAYPALPATLARGATYYVASGEYPEAVLDDAESGSVEIELRQATLTDHGTDDGWQPHFVDIRPVVFRGGLHFITGHYRLHGEFLILPNA